MDQSRPQRNNYVTKDALLDEIHKSKMTYCHYVDERGAGMFDAVLGNPKRVRKMDIAAAKESRAKKIGKAGHEAVLEEWTRMIPRSGDQENVDEFRKRAEERLKEALGMRVPKEMKAALDRSFAVHPGNSLKPKRAEYSPDPKTIPDRLLVFRVMTDEHVPPAEDGSGPEKCNFPPFKQFMLDRKGKLREVLRSHWEGGFANGEFRQDQGKISEDLARMFLLMVERYATRPNWSGYTYLDEMKGTATIQLCQAGLKFDETRSEPLNPFAYYTRIMLNSFLAVLDKEKRQSKIVEEIRVSGGMDPSFSSQVQQEWESMERRAEEDRKASALDPMSNMTFAPSSEAGPQMDFSKRGRSARKSG